MGDDYYQKGKSVFDNGYDYRKERIGGGGNTTNADIIRSASAGLGFFLTWLFYKKDNRTEEEKKEDDDKWRRSGCRKGCGLILIVWVVAALVMSIAGWF